MWNDDKQFAEDKFEMPKEIRFDLSHSQMKNLPKTGFFNESADDFGGCYLTFALIIFTCLIYVLQIAFSYGTGAEASDRLTDFGYCNFPAVFENGEFWRLLTCIFLHGSVGHLVGNMLILLICGTRVERVLYRKYYLLLYFVGGFISSLASAFYYHHVPMAFQIKIMNRSFKLLAYDPRAVGASGAIAALLGGLVIYKLFFSKISSSDAGSFSLLPFIISYILLSVIVGLFISEDGVDTAAHISGFLCGLVIMCILAFITMWKQNRQY